MTTSMMVLIVLFCLLGIALWIDRPNQKRRQAEHDAWWASFEPSRGLTPEESDRLIAAMGLTDDSAAAPSSRSAPTRSEQMGRSGRRRRRRKMHHPGR